MMDSRPFTHLGEVLYYIAVTIFTVEQIALGNNLFAGLVMGTAVCAALVRSWSLHKNHGVYPRSDFASCLVRVVCFSVATGLLAFLTEFAAYPMVVATAAFGISAWLEWSREHPVKLEWSEHSDWKTDRVGRHKRMTYHVFQNTFDEWVVTISIDGIVPPLGSLAPRNTRQEAMDAAQEDFDMRRAGAKRGIAGAQQAASTFQGVT